MPCSIPVCALVPMLNEVFSPLNFHGTRMLCGNANPSYVELVSNYHYTNAFNRFMDAHGYETNVATIDWYMILSMLAKEIMDYANYQAAQVRFSVHEPTGEQLLESYLVTGGLRLFLEIRGVALPPNPRA